MWHDNIGKQLLPRPQLRGQRVHDEESVSGRRFSARELVIFRTRRCCPSYGPSGEADVARWPSHTQGRSDPGVRRWPGSRACPIIRLTVLALSLCCQGVEGDSIPKPGELYSLRGQAGLDVACNHGHVAVDLIFAFAVLNPASSCAPPWERLGQCGRYSLVQQIPFQRASQCDVREQFGKTPAIERGSVEYLPSSSTSFAEV